MPSRDRSDLRDHLARNRSKVLARGHTWDVADVLDALDAWDAMEDGDPTVAYPPSHFRALVSRYALGDQGEGGRARRSPPPVTGEGPRSIRA